MQGESGGRRYGPGGGLLTSSAGALGEMQVMPSTAADPGFGIRPSNGSPDDHARVGREYRAAMQSRYGNDPAKMWAAYNWGPGHLDNALAQYGDNWLDHAPSATRDYIRRNLARMRGR